MKQTEALIKTECVFPWGLSRKSLDKTAVRSKDKMWNAKGGIHWPASVTSLSEVSVSCKKKLPCYWFWNFFTSEKGSTKMSFMMLNHCVKHKFTLLHRVSLKRPLPSWPPAPIQLLKDLCILIILRKISSENQFLLIPLKAQVRFRFHVQIWAKFSCY